MERIRDRIADPALMAILGKLQDEQRLDFVKKSAR